MDLFQQHQTAPKNVGKLVFEQYEYRDWLITIQNCSVGIAGRVEKCYSEEIFVFATPTRISHLLNYWDVEEQEYSHDENYWLNKGILTAEELKIYKDPDQNFLFYVYEGDTFYCRAHGDFTDECSNSADLLEYCIEQIDIATGNHKILHEYPKYFQSHPVYIVIKQLKKKTNQFLSPKKRGFKQLAWATMVKERDGACTNCGSMHDLHAHHIKPYKYHPEVRYDVSNGVTLCSTCHREHHKMHGR